MMLDVETQLRGYGEQLDATREPLNVDQVLEERVGHAPVRPFRFREPRPGRLGWVVALVSAAAVLLLVGGVAWLLGGSDSISPATETPGSSIPPAPVTSLATATTLPVTTTAAPPTTATPTAVDPTAATAPDYEGLGWRKVTSDPQVLGGDTFGAQWDQVIEGPDGYLAWGMTFTREDVERFCDDNGISCSVGGSELFQGAAWTSPDGESWTRHDATELVEVYVANPFVSGTIIAGPSGYLGVGGVEDPEGEGFILSSADGAAWTATRLEAGPQEGIFVTDLARGDPGWVVVGSFADGTTFETGVASWFSTDGQVWTRTEWSREATNEFPAGRDVVAAGSGFVAVGEDFSTWSSPDGVTWTRGTDLPGFDPNQGWMRLELLALDGTLVVVGEGGTVWISTDTQSWTLIHQEDFGLDTNVGFLRAAGAGGVGMVAYGQDINGSHLFISPDGINWTTLETPPHTRTVGPFGDNGLIAGVHSVWPPMTPDLTGVEVWIWTPPR